jgi:hypothetical protein
VASANSLKMCLHYQAELISNHNLYKMTNRATPEMLCDYKLHYKQNMVKKMLSLTVQTLKKDNDDYNTLSK